MTRLDDTALDLIFRNARTQNGWRDEPVAAETLRAVYDVMRMGPTSANCTPLRIVFLTTPAAKERLMPALLASNVAKTRSAPVTAILGYDLEFYDKLPRLFPHDQSARSWFAGKPDAIESTAFRNSSLQGAYFIIAARALGLDCGPMSGFDPAKVDAEFFPDGKVKSNFLCNLGHGDPSKIFARSPRLAFEEACTVL